MLIRIGDEKRELIDAHLTVLCNKFIELLNKGDQDMLQDAISMFRQVIENMPHKVSIYASLIGLMVQHDSTKVVALLEEIINKSFQEQLVEKRDGFKCRNLFRWFGFLIELRVIGALPACQFLIHLIDNDKHAQELVLHSVLTSLSTENVSLRLESEASGSFNVLKAKLQSSYASRNTKAQVRHQAQGFVHADIHTTLWNLYQKKTYSPHRDVYMSVSQAKEQEIKSKLSNSPFSLVPNL